MTSQRHLALLLAFSNPVTDVALLDIIPLIIGYRVCEGYLMSTQPTVSTSTRPTPTWHIGETSAPLPPQVAGSPVVGNAMDMGTNPARFLVNMYQQHGPIFRIQLMDHIVTVLAGLEANQFTTQHDEEVFTNEFAFAALQSETGPTVTAQPNAEHRHLRRLLRPAYGRSVALDQVDQIIGIADAFVDSLTLGESFDVFPSMQKLVVNQLGQIMRGQQVGDYFDDVRLFMKTMLEVYQYHMKPLSTLEEPEYKRAKARSFEMAANVLAYARENPPGESRPANSLDLLMNATDLHDKAFGPEHLLSESLGPYLAGQDTVASTLCFLMYVIHKQPELLERLTVEARTGLANGTFDANSIRKFELLHNTIVEVMRLYPVAPIMPRHAAQTFEFAGHKVTQGDEVYSATTVTHFLPEFFPDPYTFNIDRPRGQAGTFVPYGVGSFACLGAGMADVQLLVTSAVLLRSGRFQLDPIDYEMKFSVIPLPNPGQYNLKLLARENGS